MPRMKGHKRGCRCVGCNPAARARGMRKLRALQKAGKLRRRPRSGRRGNPVKDERQAGAATGQLTSKARAYVRAMQRFRSKLSAESDSILSALEYHVKDTDRVRGTWLYVAGGVALHKAVDRALGNPELRRVAAQGTVATHAQAALEDAGLKAGRVLGPFAAQENPHAGEPSKAERDRQAELTLEAVEAAAQLEYRFKLYGQSLVDALREADDYHQRHTAPPLSSRERWRKLIRKVEGIE